MQTTVTFRRFQDADRPGEGEVWLRHVPQVSTPAGVGKVHGLADLVLKGGLGALEKGPGDVARIVVQHDPTFDDMLAATVADHLLTGRPLPPGLRAFTAYAGLIRQGFQPGELPLQESLEGIYLALRRENEGDLTQAEPAGRFVASWARMEARILEAAGKEQDPRKSPLFEDLEFAAERAVLNEDRDVYRQDVLRGERWVVRVPNGPPEASGLMLRGPRSRLWKSWTRRDPEAPVGGGYLFLALLDPDWGWSFSTPPAQGIQLRELHARLQEAEGRKTPAGTTPAAWFDGQRFSYTLVGAPKAGTRLSDEEVLAVVRAWTSARRVSDKKASGEQGGGGGGTGRPRWAAAVLAVLALPVLVGLGVWGVQKFKDDGGQVAVKDGGDHRDGPTTKPVVVELPPAKKDHRVREVSLSGGRMRSGGQEAVHAPPAAVFAVERDMNLPPGEVCTFEVKEGNEFTQGRAVRLGIQVFPQEEQSAPLPVALEAIEVNGDSISLRDVRTIRGAESIKVERLPITVRARENTLRIRLKNQGTAPLPITAAVSWSDDPKAVTLHVLAVGVSVYKDPELRLNSADKDAVDLARALQMFGKDLFSKVVIHGVNGTEAALTNAEATRENVINALHALKGQVQEHDLLVVVFSGHGARAEDGNYYFLPHDYNPKGALDATAVSWDVIKKPLEAMRCRVVVVLDTCHSGAAGMRGGPDLQPDLDAAVQKALSQLASARRGIILLAACLGDQKTPDDFWGHGVLSLALLEGVQEKLLAPKDAGTPQLPRERHPNNPVITLEDLQEYASARVRNLVKLKSLQADQAVILRPLGDIVPQQIPLALFPPSPSGSGREGK
jgi:uncharacterized caspase-like protein